jgi:hypothetical protein
VRLERPKRKRWARLAATAALAWLAFASLPSAVVAQRKYPNDLARKLASPAEIREATTIRSRLRKETSQTDPLYTFVPQAFEAILPLPNSQSKPGGRPKQWDLPPFATLDPALPADLPDEIKREYEQRRRQSAVHPDGFSDIGLEGQEIDKYSALLVPRPFQPGEEINVEVDSIPPPFSVRRYYDEDKDVFVEVAAYGGSTWSKAEEAYKAIKQSVLEQQPMQGFGEAAFLARLEIKDPSTVPPVEEIPEVLGPAMPEIPPFAELEPEDRARPELVDSARAAALSAPSFSELAVKDLEGKSIHYPKDLSTKKYYPKGGEVRQTVQVLVAFYPDEGLTLSFAVEERMGTVQDLVQLAMLAQRNLKEKILARD